ncbi:TonB-dependent receptor [Marinifilum breve]|uniref:TonB-dependent receptor n=1 Tax=Marinifilum breve TaxID=2184082 RepID=A0A2V4A6Y6_9BACT|nr:TonB-dependent receptor [Marinifilum breve]PXY03130.1 TonB-dependent receptor [Marinifilum breve]
MKKTMRKLSLLGVVLCAFVSMLHAQTLTVSGKVSDQSGLGLPGVNVVIKGFTSGTVTDFDGNYTIEAEKGNVLLFSFIGYKSKEVVCSTESKIDVVLEEETIGVDEVVVVGYGTQKKANLTGAVSSMRIDDAVNQPVTNTTQLLQGKMTGVHLTQGGGQPGKDAATIHIRGIATNGESGPLVLVDGVERSLGDVAPSDIESISVLKDAASAAIYGSRAANGVILITTKTGEAGKLKVKYNAYYGWQEASVLPKIMDAATYAELINEATGEVRYSEEEIAKIKDGSDPDRYSQTNWAKEIFRTSPVTNHYLSFSGGSEKTSYVFSMNYMDQEGIMLGSSAKRYNMRAKIDSQIKKWLKIGVNIDGSVKNIKSPLDDLSGDGGIMRRIYFDTPVAPVKYSNGDWAVQDGSEAFFIKNVAFRSQLGKNEDDQYRLNAKFYANLNLLKGLEFRTNVAYSYYNALGTKFSPTFSLNDLDGNPVVTNDINTLKDNSATWHRLLNENILKYNVDFDKHSINALLGHSIETYRKDAMNSQISGFPNNEIHELNAGSIDPTVSGSAQELKLQSFFGRVNYAYDSKYLFEANLRIDSSSRFAKGNRTGYFPSFSVGWRVSEESFLADAEFLSNLKVRASWGKLGNQNIGNSFYPYEQTYNLGQDYIFTDGASLVGGAAITGLANRNLKWESTETYDLGIDFGIGNNFSMSFDYFHKRTNDLLLKLPQPLSLGSAAPYQNAGEAVNKGWEVSGEYHGKTGDLSYSVGFNLSRIQNEWTDLKGTEFYPTNRIHREGEAMFSYYGWQAIGIFQTDEEVANAATPSNSAAPGDIIYKDVSGPDGVPDGKIDDNDRVIIGNPIPEFTYGLNGSLNYKGIDFAFLFQGVKNVDRYVSGTGNHAGNGDRANWTPDWVNRWTAENPSSKYPRLGHNRDNDKQSSYWVQDASYLRLKNLEIGYTFPQALSKKAGIERLRIYMSGQNLLTFTDYKNWDPEKAIGNIRSESYPLAKTYTLGVNLTF